MERMSEKVGLTYEDLFSFPDDDLRRELLDGELLVSPSPRVRHQEVLGRLHLIVGGHVRAHGGGRVFIAPTDILFSQATVLVPDLIFVGEDRLGIVTEPNLKGVPTLLVEVLSDARRDRILKLGTYARHGVPEYWIVDPENDQVEVYRLQEQGVYAAPETLQAPQALTTEHIPGLEVSLEEIFERD